VTPQQRASLVVQAADRLGLLGLVIRAKTSTSCYVELYRRRGSPLKVPLTGSGARVGNESGCHQAPVLLVRCATHANLAFGGIRAAFTSEATTIDEAVEELVAHGLERKIRGTA